MKKAIHTGFGNSLFAFFFLLVLGWQPVAQGATVNVVAQNFSFSPANVSIQINDTVHWSNPSSGLHTVTSSTDFFSASELQFSTFDFTFTSAGVFNYYCEIHGIPNSGMNGNVTVAAAANTPPSVTITSPANNAVFNAPASFAINATASDPDVGGSVSQVEFFNGTTSVGIDFTSAYSANIASLSAGNYTLSAVATDNLGAKATNKISVIVNALPTVSITNPVNQAVFASPAAFNLQATAVDSDGSVTQVEFFQGATSLGISTSPFQRSLASLADGTYVLKAVATDNLGATNTSALVTVTVTTLQLNLPVFSSGQFQLKMNGLVPGKTNLLQASTTLTNWVTIATNIAGAATLNITDPNATNRFQFYRVIQLP